MNIERFPVNYFYVCSSFSVFSSSLRPSSLLPLFLISILSKFSKYLDLLMPAPRIYSSLCGCSLNIRIPGVLDHYGHWVYVWFLRKNLYNISKHSALVWLAHTNFSINKLIPVKHRNVLGCQCLFLHYAVLWPTIDKGSNVRIHMYVI